MDQLMELKSILQIRSNRSDIVTMLACLGVESSANDDEDDKRMRKGKAAARMGETNGPLLSWLGGRSDGGLFDEDMVPQRRLCLKPTALWFSLLFSRNGKTA
jgi:hypothetical protein